MADNSTQPFLGGAPLPKMPTAAPAFASPAGFSGMGDISLGVVNELTKPDPTIGGIVSYPQPAPPPGAALLSPASGMTPVRASTPAVGAVAPAPKSVPAPAPAPVSARAVPANGNNIDVLNGGRYVQRAGHTLVNPTQAAAIGELQRAYSPQMMALRELMANEQVKHQLAIRLASLPEGDPMRAEIAARYQNFTSPEAQAHEQTLRTLGMGFPGAEIGMLGLGLR